MNSKKTLVLGASENPERVCNQAVRKLVKYGHDVIAVGLRPGKIDDTEILSGTPLLHGIDTISLYLGAKNQAPLYEYILSLNPNRIIFNPGAENDELAKLANKSGIETEEACTLVLLSLGQY